MTAVVVPLLRAPARAVRSCLGVISAPTGFSRRAPRVVMPAKIVDLSARSSIIEAEPFGLHFWECTPKEFLNYLKDPRGFLASMGIKLPKNCRIETTIEN